jgi:hypothetical protein
MSRLGLRWRCGNAVNGEKGLLLVRGAETVATVYCDPSGRWWWQAGGDPVGTWATRDGAKSDCWGHFRRAVCG